MKIVDLNILIYAVNRAAVEHVAVHAWWQKALAGDESIGLPWVVVLGFIRVTTNPRTFATPFSVDEALHHINTWLAQPSVRIIQESPEHWRLLGGLLRQVGTAGNLTTDTHLAAMAIGHGATLVSCDTDFARFTKVRWENPLATP